MNLCIFSGRVSNKSQVSTSQSGTKIARYTFAVDDNYTDDSGNRKTHFLNMVAFNGNADFVEKHVEVGDKLIVQASVSTGSYTNKDGQKIYTTEYVVNRQEFDESKAEKERRKAEKATQNAAPAYQPPYAPMPNYNNAAPVAQPSVYNNAVPAPQPTPTPVAPVPQYTAAPVAQTPVYNNTVPTEQPAPTAPTAPIAPIPGGEFLNMPGNYYNDGELPFN